MAISGDTTRPPTDFVAVDKEPEMLVKKERAYHALALKAGLEGKLWLKVWIDQPGNAHDARVTRSGAEIFNQAAVDTAKAFRFKLAILNGKPVSVWVAIRFKIAGSDTSEAALDTGVGMLQDFIHDIAAGKAIDNTRIHAFMYPKAEGMIGRKIQSLIEALKKRGNAHGGVEWPGREISLLRSVTDEDGSGLHMIFETKPEGQNRTNI